MNIVGVGHAFPQTRIDTPLLESLGPLGDLLSGASREAVRYSSLSLDYLKNSGNAEPRKAESNALVTPTQLAKQAVELAVRRAGIEVADIGLIIAGCTTPLEICPAESQRIGNVLGLKIPAYDISGSSLDFALHIQTVMSWKPEKTPRFVLCVSTNLPTQRIDYRSGAARYFVGDGAAALILSPTERGKFLVEGAQVRNDTKKHSLFHCDLYEHAVIDIEGSLNWMRDALQKEYVALKTHVDIKESELSLIGNQFGGFLQRELAEREGIDSARSWENANEAGCSLGSAPVTVLSERWETVESGQLVAMLAAGAGMGSGFVCLRVNE